MKKIIAAKNQNQKSETTVVSFTLTPEIDNEDNPNYYKLTIEDDEHHAVLRNISKSDLKKLHTYLSEILNFK